MARAAAATTKGLEEAMARAAAAETRGRRRLARGEVAELALARPSTPPSGGQRPRRRRWRVRLRPRTRRRRVRRDPSVSALSGFTRVSLFLVFGICVILCSISMSVSGFSTVVDGRVTIAYQFLVRCIFSGIFNHVFLARKRGVYFLAFFAVYLLVLAHYVY